MPFLVGGAYAFERYTGIARHTKDLDVFVREADYPRALAALEADGCRGEVPFAHWLAKAYCGDHFVDLIFGSGNGVAPVDDDWFAHAVDETVFDIPVKLVPAEEMIWQKALIMERERFDGADVAHVLRARADVLDWDRLLDRFGGALAGPAEPPDPVRLHLPRGAGEDPDAGDAGAAGSGRESARRPPRTSRAARTGRSATGRCSRGRSTWSTWSSGGTRTPGSGRSAAMTADEAAHWTEAGLDEARGAHPAG